MNRKSLFTDHENTVRTWPLPALAKMPKVSGIASTQSKPGCRSGKDKGATATRVVAATPSRSATGLIRW